MRRHEIPKRGGGVRVVFAPSVKEKILLRQEMRRITSHTPTTLPFAHGFMPGRSPLTAAMEHRGFPITIGLDLKDFFPSVQPHMVKGLLPKDINPLVWAGDGCGQGLPTAPMVANLAAKSLDEAIVKAFKKKEKAGVVSRFAYSRYADDLSISFEPDPGQEVVMAFKQQLAEICARCGFKPNPKKWHIQRADGGRREIVGLLVGEVDDPIRPRKAWRHNFRAIKHKIACLEYDLDLMGDEFSVWRRRGRMNQEVRDKALNELGRLKAIAQGWEQWADPKLPNTPEQKERKAHLRRLASRVNDANRICAKAGIRDLPVVERCFEEVEEKVPGTNWIARITSDPCYYVGISDFVTRSQSTSSCMRLGLAWPGSRRGQYGGGGAWWWHLRGARIAHIIDPKQEVVMCGVKRPAQLARVLIFQTRNGGVWYQARIYHGNDQAYRALKNFLHRRGINDVRESDNYQRGRTPDDAVVGNVPDSLGIQRPYLDYGGFDSAKGKSGKLWKVVL